MDYIRRIEKLKSGLESCDAILIEKDVDLFYLTGMKLSAGSLLVHAAGACLLVDGRYYELCRKSAPVEVILSDQTPLSKAVSQMGIGVLGFDAHATTYQRFMELQAFSLKLLPVDSPVRMLRMIKDAEEIALLRQSAALGAEGFDFVASLLREGITENEVALELEIFWKRRGSKGVAFEPIIAFGSNSAMPHYRSGNVALKNGMNVLIDIGVNYHNYLSDMTRVLFLGEPDPKMKEIYSVAAQAQRAAMAVCRPGTLIGQVDRAARELIAQHGYGSFFTHSLGHGVGLEIHELPTLRQKAPYDTLPLEAGMCITIEPGIYLPGFGGVRLEDTIVITESGYENLTNRPLLY